MNAINRAIYHAITTDVLLMKNIPGGVHYAMKANQDGFPMVIFSESDGDYRRTFQRIVWRRLTYLIKVVDTGYSIVTAKEIDDELRKKFDGGDLVLTGEWATAICRRLRDITYSEAIGGVVYWHVGGIYQLGLRRQ